jgi:hypothetical protein
MKPNRTYTGFGRTLATTALLASVTPMAMQAQNGNPWNPYPARHDQATPVQTPAPAPVQAKPKYYQDSLVTPVANAAQAAPGPSRFAPADLDMRLSAGLPARPDAAETAPAIPNPYLTRQATIGAPQNPYAPTATPGYGAPAYSNPAYSNPGYGAANPGYGQAYAPGYGAPYASNGIPGNFNGFFPPPGNIASNPFSGFGFSPFGFW